MRKRKKAALYNPFLDTLGGGEKHILSILKVLEMHEYEPYIFWDKDLTKDIKDKFNLGFKNIRFEKNFFPKSGFINKISSLHDYDIFFYVTDGSYFLSTAKKNFIFCMVPQQSLYAMTPMNRLKTVNSHFISNSEFTRKWLSRWGIHSEVIHPYIDDKLIDMNINKLKKDKIILSVGRFFGHLHAKKHDAVINTYRNLKKINKNFSDYRLVIAGSLQETDQDYFNSIKKLAGRDAAISLETNITYERLIELYKKSSYYWHFTGYETDENQYPERVEHLGITPLEAMAAGCITACYNAGGPRYIITSGRNGYLFSDQEQLFKQMEEAENRTDRRKMIQEHAQEYVRNNFSFSVFKNRVEELIIM